MKSAQKLYVLRMKQGERNYKGRREQQTISTEKLGELQKISDGIPAEYLKAGGDVLAEHLRIVLQKVWSEVELPPEYQRNMPNHQKVDVKGCSNNEKIHA